MTPWLPSGVALAVVTLKGRRMCAAPITLLATIRTQAPPTFVAGAVISNLLEAVVGAYLLKTAADLRLDLGRIPRCRLVDCSWRLSAPARWAQPSVPSALCGIVAWHSGHNSPIRVAGMNGLAIPQAY
ncbi:MAG: hypothetical protein U0694_17250 [Anaerolineae bacterium]